jgi:flagellar motor component MotA
MSNSNWMGVVLFSGIYVAMFLFSDNAGLLLNGIGLTVVISGTLGAMFLSYPGAEIRAALRVAANTYSSKMISPGKSHRYFARPCRTYSYGRPPGA